MFPVDAGSEKMKVKTIQSYMSLNNVKYPSSEKNART